MYMDDLPPRSIFSDLAVKPIFTNTGWHVLEEDKSNYNNDNVHADLFCEKCNEIKTFSGKTLAERDLHKPQEQVQPTKASLLLKHARRTFTSSEENNESFDETIKKHTVNSDEAVIVRLTCPKCQSVVRVCYAVEEKISLATLVTTYCVHKIGEYPDQTKSRLRYLSQYKEHFPEEYEFLKQAEKAYQNGLSAGAIIYIRKAYESLINNILKQNGKEYVKNNFRNSLEKADEIDGIIPPVLKDKAYGLFRELSDIVHRGTDVEGMKKFEPLRDLFIHILNKILENRKLEKFAENIRLDESKQRTPVSTNKASPND